MKINVQTFIETDEDLSVIFKLFNKDMFYYLTKNAPVKPIRYDGDEIGAEIHLQLTIPWKDEWVSVITERVLEDDCCYFVDEGAKLPFNIRTWKHKHIVHKVDRGVIIEDDITFTSTDWFSDRFWWLSFLPQFLARKSQYRKYIKECLK
ncbi:MAG: hypothetical protein GY827_09470 [Cytophagales bacterium]|nr:hypothetical protein [Cytophagales bacterium]